MASYIPNKYYLGLLTLVIILSLSIDQCQFIYRQQVGGQQQTQSKKPEVYTQELQTVQLPQTVDIGALEPPSKPNIPENIIIPSSENWKTRRMSGVLYSGDIINILPVNSQNQYFQKNKNGQVILDIPLPHSGSNLSKLRFERPDHETDIMKMINYNEPVLLKHNSYINNENRSFYINHGEQSLTTHNNESISSVYRIRPLTGNINRTDPVSLDEPLLISTGEPDNILYVGKVRSDTKELSGGLVRNNATKFNLELVRNVNKNDEHLAFTEMGKLYL